MPITPAATSPIGRTSSSLKRIDMPWRVASSTSLCPLDRRTQPRRSPSLTRARVKVLAVAPGISARLDFFTMPCADTVSTYQLSSRSLLGGRENSVAGAWLSCRAEIL